MRLLPGALPLNACPLDARPLSHTLLQAVAAEFKGQLRAADLDELWTRFSSLQLGWASTELQDDVGSRSMPSLDHQDLGDVAGERPCSRCCVHLLRALAASAACCCCRCAVQLQRCTPLPANRIRDPSCLSAGPATLPAACPPPGWSARQQQVMGNLLRIRAVAQENLLRQVGASDGWWGVAPGVGRCFGLLWAAPAAPPPRLPHGPAAHPPSLRRQWDAEQEAERTTEFLWAASQGAEAKVRQMLQAGTNPNAADYGKQLDSDVHARVKRCACGAT